MAVYTKRHLSGSTSGRPIPIVATATPGTDIHTAVAGNQDFDEVYLWATNVTAATRRLTIEWGGVTNPGDHLVHTLSIPAFSPPVPIATGLIMNGALEIAAFCDQAGGVNIEGFVNRIEV